MHEEWEMFHWNGRGYVMRGCMEISWLRKYKFMMYQIRNVATGRILLQLWVPD